MASRCLRIIGSGTSTTCTCRFPYQQLAFIVLLPAIPRLGGQDARIGPHVRPRVRGVPDPRTARSYFHEVLPCLPAGWPSVVITSPVSITCLNRRKSIFMERSGF